MAICAPKVSIWHWDPRHTLLDDQSAKKVIILICSSCSWSFGYLKKVIFEVCYAVLTPSLGPKVPPRSPFGLIPLIPCIASPTNQKTDLVC